MPTRHRRQRENHSLGRRTVPAPVSSHVLKGAGIMSYDPFSALTFITGPAILTNACAILQNGATTRYNLAITQWREFQASIAEDENRLFLLFVDPERALLLAERRIHLQLRALGLLNA